MHTVSHGDLEESHVPKLALRPLGQEGPASLGDFKELDFLYMSLHHVDYLIQPSRDVS